MEELEQCVDSAYHAVVVLSSDRGCCFVCLERVFFFENFFLHIGERAFILSCWDDFESKRVSMLASAHRHMLRKRWECL